MVFSARSGETGPWTPERFGRLRVKEETIIFYRYKNIFEVINSLKKIN